MGERLLEVKDISISFTQYESGFKRREIPAIRDLSLTVEAGQVTAVIGSSGSGKSLLAHAVLGLLPYNASLAGEMVYRGQPLDDRRRRELRGKEIVLVPQSVSYLDPLMKVGPQIGKGSRAGAVKKKALEVLERFGLGPEVQNLYPFQLSGGMTRRVLISTAVMESPRMVIADEPTPGLHIEAARRVLSHFKEMAQEGAGVLLITHDLQLALEAADRVAVLYAGTVIEDAPAAAFKEEKRLLHPYSRALYRAMPEHDFSFVPGSQPYVTRLPEGCPYGPRCPYAQEVCRGGAGLFKVGDTWVRCVRAAGIEGGGGA